MPAPNRRRKSRPLGPSPPVDAASVTALGARFCPRIAIRPAGGTISPTGSRVGLHPLGEGRQWRGRSRALRSTTSTPSTRQAATIPARVTISTAAPRNLANNSTSQPMWDLTPAANCRRLTVSRRPRAQGVPSPICRSRRPELDHWASRAFWRRELPGFASLIPVKRIGSRIAVTPASPRSVGPRTSKGSTASA